MNEADTCGKCVVPKLAEAGCDDAPHFIGAAVSGFACFLAAVIKILSIRFEFKRNPKADNSSEATP